MVRTIVDGSVGDDTSDKSGRSGESSNSNDCGGIGVTTFSITTFGIITPSVMILFATLSIIDTKHK